MGGGDEKDCTTTRPRRGFILSSALRFRVQQEKKKKEKKEEEEELARGRFDALCVLKEKKTSQTGA